MSHVLLHDVLCFSVFIRHIRSRTEIRSGIRLILIRSGPVSRGRIWKNDRVLGRFLLNGQHVTMTTRHSDKIVLVIIQSGLKRWAALCISVTTIKHQMFGPELNRWFCENVGFFLVRQFIFLIDYTQTNQKIRYLSVTNILLYGPVLYGLALYGPALYFVHRTLMFYSTVRTKIFQCKVENF